MAQTVGARGLQGLAWLLVFQVLGELLTRALGWPFPGPVLGLVLLLPALRWKWINEAVSACAALLLGHLSLLFVPVGVGVMTHLGLVHDYGFRIVLVLVVSTWVGLAVTALTLRGLLRKESQGMRDA